MPLRAVRGRQIRVSALAAAGVFFLLTSVGVPRVRAAHDEPRESPPQQPLVDGQKLFESKGCVQCHSVAGTGETRVGPDLGQDRGWRDLMQFAGSLWNHAPAMLQKMTERNLTPAKISPDEMSSLAAYLLFLRFRSAPGDAAHGRVLFQERSCARCHQLGGQGGTVGPRLDELREYASAFFLAQALWNHGPDMAAKMEQLKIERPRLEGNDVADLVAFIRGAAAGADGPMELAYAQSGNPAAGQSVFRDKGCIKCHTIGGKGGSVGPNLSAGHHAPQNAGEIAGALWNHGPQMWAKMKELGVPFPRMTDREMADLLSYLYYARIVGHGGDANRGRQLLAEKSCAACHAVGGVGPKVGPDLAKVEAVGSPIRWASAMWNHAPMMEQRMHEAQLAWPQFEDDQMRDLVEFLKTRNPHN